MGSIWRFSGFVRFAARCVERVSEVAHCVHAFNSSVDSDNVRLFGMGTKRITEAGDVKGFGLLAYVKLGRHCAACGWGITSTSYETHSPRN
jgi:hypothetical protein